MYAATTVSQPIHSRSGFVAVADGDGVIELVADTVPDAVADGEIVADGDSVDEGECDALAELDGESVGEAEDETEDEEIADGLAFEL